VQFGVNIRHRDGGRTFHDIQSFGKGLPTSNLIDHDWLFHRHPYLAQIYGTVKTAKLHAVVFHDGRYLSLLR
jgi:hypothetical protein